MLNFLFGFSGRIRRRDYFFGLLGMQVAAGLITVALILTSGDRLLVLDPRRPDMLVLTVQGRLVLSCIFCSVVWVISALYFKRIHDIGEGSRSSRNLKIMYFFAVAPYCLLNLLSLLVLGQREPTMLGMVVTVALFLPAFIRPEKGPNRFGPNPLDVAAEADGQAAAPAKMVAAVVPNALRMKEMARSGSASAFGAQPISGKVAFGKR